MYHKVQNTWSTRKWNTALKTGHSIKQKIIFQRQKNGLLSTTNITHFLNFYATLLFETRLEEPRVTKFADCFIEENTCK